MREGGACFGTLSTGFAMLLRICAGWQGLS
jgi:hypothetical protein